MKINELKKVIKICRARNLGGGNDILISVEGVFYAIKSAQFIVDDSTGQQHLTFCAEENPTMPDYETTFNALARLRIKFGNLKLQIKVALIKLITSSFGGSKK